LAGLETSLDMAGHQYNIALSILFVSYVSWEIPSNLLLKNIRPSIYLPCIVMVWGVVTTCTGVAQSFGGLVACRLILGFAEAGLFPGCLFYLTTWYPRHQFLFRFSIFFAASTLAGAFGGLLAAGISNMNGVAGQAGWRWIFILEGILTVLIGLLGLFVMCDGPTEASFLSAEEKEELQLALEKDAQGAKEVPFNWAEVRAAFMDWKVWVSAVVCIGVALPTFSFALFLPTIIRSLGFQNVVAQLLTVPQYAAAFLFTIGVGWHSDVKRIRAPYLVIFNALAMLGYILLLAYISTGVSYFATFLTAIGLFTSSALNMTWLANNLFPSTKRAAGSAMQVAVGQLGGIAGAYIYLDGPRFFLGHGMSLGFLVMATLATCLQWFLLHRLNNRGGFQYTC